MNTEYKCVTTVDGIRDYIGGSGIVAFDFETAPDDPYREEDKAALDPARAHIVGCSFSVKEGTGIYVPIAHRIGTNIDRDAFFTFLTAFLMNTTTIKIAHNIAFESSPSPKAAIIVRATSCRSVSPATPRFILKWETDRFADDREGRSKSLRVPYADSGLGLRVQIFVFKRGINPVNADRR